MFTPHPSLATGRLSVCLLTTLTLCGACSFDIPAEINASTDQGSSQTDSGMRPDVTLLDADPDGGRPSPDMPPSLDTGMDAPRDMPDAGTPVDMPASGEDMREVDMPSPGMLGDRCEDDASCAQGSCLEVAGDTLCAVACVQGGCTQFGFGCVDGVCVPDAFCADDGVTGPACLTCARCDDAAQCNEIIDGSGQTIYQCVCPQGYYGDGNTCIDRNECAEATAQCDQNATCTNTNGGFDCLCDPGFMGDGTTCTPMQSTCDMCSEQATCLTDPQGMERCACDQGWVGNGIMCQDLDECVTPGQGQCPTNERCANLSGSFACECDDGYSRVGPTCEDINECSTNPCDALATCTNTPGNFQCDCPAGVAGNGIVCQPYGSCAEIAAALPGSPTGEYWVRTQNGTQLQVWCDMDSDGGVGYTLHRVDSASLQTTQQAYASACTQLGMEIVTPRSQEHMDAIIAWNSTPPNIINVFPNSDNVTGIGNFSARCTGQTCSFFVNGRDNTRCRTISSSPTLNTWSSGEIPASCYDYLQDAGSPAPTGSYVIDPDGLMGARPAFTTLCAMMLDGGGWTLAATTSDDDQDTWTWDERTLWTSNEANVGNAPLYNKDYKNAAVHDLPIRDLSFYHEPSKQWASYHGVNATPTETISSLLNSAPNPECDPNDGFVMTQGTISAGGKLCSTNLYLHAGDYDNDIFNVGLGQTRCNNYRTFGTPRDESTWGFSWSQTNDQSCPFDDPAYSSWGANHWVKDSETNGNGFAQPLDLNTLPADQGLNYMHLLVRGDKPSQPDGQNSTTQRLVLEALPSGDAGTDCPYGSWDDRGNQVVEQGWVVCGINE